MYDPWVLIRIGVRRDPEPTAAIFDQLTFLDTPEGGEL